ncbi:MAG: hypothetical protein AB1540_03580 [Bdellovibrionota bacterium]
MKKTLSICLLCILPLLPSCSKQANEATKNAAGISTEDQRYSGSPTGYRHPAGRTSSNVPDEEYSNTTEKE